MNAETTVICTTSTELSPTAGAYGSDGHHGDEYYETIVIQRPGEDSVPASDAPPSRVRPETAAASQPRLTEPWDEPTTIWSCSEDSERSVRAARDLHDILANVGEELALPTAHTSSRERGWAERRERERISIGGPVRFRTIDCEQVHIGWLKNVSSEGAQIETDAAPTAGTLVALGFCVTSGGRHHVFRSMAEVRWRRLPRGALDGGFGVRFVQPSSDAQLVLQRLLSSAS